MKRKKSNRIIFTESMKTIHSLLEDCENTIPKIKEIQIFIIESSGDKMGLSLEWNGKVLQKFAEYIDAEQDLSEWEEEEENKPVLLN